MYTLRQFHIFIRILILGLIVGASSGGESYADVPPPPTGFLTGGLFAQYFRNMTTFGGCPMGQKITGFSGANTLGYLTPVCGLDTWQFNGSNNFYFNSSNNLGIGTNNPQTGLHLSGSLRLDLPAGTQNNSVLTSDVSGVARWQIFPNTCTPTGAGGDNVCHGTNVLQLNTNGSYNTSIGNYTLRNNITGGGNSAFGYTALTSNTASGNTAIGASALYNNTIGTINTGLGYLSLIDQVSGDYNIGIGYKAGSGLTSGSNNIAIGKLASLPTPNGSNQLSIGNLIYAISMDNAGGGNLGIGTKVPSTRLDISNSQADGIQMTFDATQNYRAWIRPYWNSVTDTRIDFAIARNSGSIPTTIMSIGYNGNVGIGSTTPATSLHVVSSPDEVARFQSSGDPYISLYRGATRNAYWWTNASNEMFLMNEKNAPTYIGSSGAIDLALLPNGSVGMGINTPGARLHISDTSIVTGYSRGIQLDTRNTNAHPLMMFASSGTDIGYVGYGSNSAGVNSLSLMNNSNNTLQLGTNATTMMTVLPNGNIGIGTGTPLQRLDVNGNIAVNGDIYGGLGGSTRGIWKFSTTYPNYGIFYTEGTPDILSFSTTGGGAGNPDLMLNGGNVGIGTNTPLYRLDVRDDSATPQMLIRGSQGAGGDHALGFTTASGTDWVGKIGHLGSKTGVWSFDMWTDEISPLTFWNSNLERMRIDSSGNMGIGTTNPGAKLHIAGNIKIVDGTQGAGKILTSDATGLATWINPGTGMPAVGAAGQTLYSNGTNWVASSNIFNNNGNVGIGTISPGTKLDVNGDIRSNASLIATNGTNATWDFTKISSDGTTSYYNAGDAQGGIAFQFDGVEKMRLLQNGNLGIGINNPGEKLDVAGRVRVGRGGLVSEYGYTANETRTKTIWSIGSSWNLDSAPDTSFGTLYGMAYSYDGYGGLPGWGHQISFHDNGTKNAAISLSNGNAFFNGNVGIGTTTPSTKLDVNGGIIASTSVTAPNFIGNATSASAVPWTGITGKPSLFTYDGWVGNPGYDANTIIGNKSGFSYSNNAPHTGPLAHFDAGGYGLEFSADYNGGGEGISFRTRNGDAGSWNLWNRLITPDTIASYAPGLTGAGASGTWGIHITGNAVSANTAASSLRAISAGSYGSTEVYGSNSGWSGIRFDSPNSVFMVRDADNYSGLYKNNNTFVWAFDPSGSLVSGSVPWASITGKPTTVSTFTNDSGYITTSGRSYPRKVGGGDINFNWNGQAGQPTWLWGGENGTDMYVYNPSNFSVNYATTAGTANAVSWVNVSGKPTTISGYGITDAQIFNTWQYGHYSDTNGAEHARRFYDTDSSSYYTDPDSTSVMNIVNASQFVYSSDKTLKKDIVPLSDSLSKILSLNGYTFSWKSTGKRDIGVIAQEVEKIYPDLVHTDPTTGLKSVEYGNLIAPLIESIKTQQKIIQVQDARIESLEKRLEKLEKNIH